MVDIFDHKVLCKQCNKQMEKTEVQRSGFVLRALTCPRGHETIIHPVDKEEYERFMDLKKKEYRVKMRLVGNSYAVSIPREIVNFMNEQDKLMNDMVRLCFEDLGKLSLNFDEIIKGEKRI